MADLQAPTLTDVVKTLNNKITQVSASGEVETDTGTIGGATTGTTHVIVQTDQPTGLNMSTDVGTIWEDTDNGNRQFWDGLVWDVFSGLTPSFGGSTDLAAFGPYLIAHSLSNMLVHVGTAAPSTPANGDAFKNTSTNIYQRYNGTSWVTISDVNIQTAIDDAIANADITDGNFTIFFQAGTPSAQTTGHEGDLWYDIDDNYKKYYWNPQASAWLGAGEVVQSITDGLPPGGSPTPTLQSGIGALFISWDEITNTDPVTYNVYVSTNSAVPTTSAEYAGSTAGTFMVLRTLPDGTAFVSGTNYYARIIARDDDGLAPQSAVSAAGTVIAKITQTEISNGAVNTPQLNANAITTDLLLANNAWIGALRATNFVGETITGPLIQTSSGSVSGVKMTPSGANPGLTGYDGTRLRFWLNTNGQFTLYDSSGGQALSFNANTGKYQFGGDVTSSATIQGAVVRTQPSGSVSSWVEMGPTDFLGFGGGLRFIVSNVVVGSIENAGTGSIWRSADGNFSIGLPADTGTGSNSVGIVGNVSFSSGWAHFLNGLTVTSGGMSVTGGLTLNSGNLDVGNNNIVNATLGAGGTIDLNANLVCGTSGTITNARGIGITGPGNTLTIDNPPTTTNSANANINSTNGNLRLVSSLSDHKLVQEDITLAEALGLLKLTPKTWYDKSDYEDNQDSFDGLRRIPGLIAQDVEANAPIFALYNGADELQSVAYDRISAGLILLVKDLYNQVAELKRTP